MNNASLALWLNVGTNAFANGPFDSSPFFVPLETVQASEYVIDIYFVTPTPTLSSPWIYNDPNAYLTAATLAIGNQFSYDLYASTNSYTRLIDNYGPKARFTLSVTGSNLTNDLSEQGSVIAVLQAGWTTTGPASSPFAQLQAVINKMLPTS